MIRNITLKVWNNNDYLLSDKRIQVTDEYVKDDKIKISFDEGLFQALQDDTSYELKLDGVHLTITNVYKSGKWMVMDYIGG